MLQKGVPYYYKLEASYEDNEGYKTVTTYAGKCIINPLPAPSSLEANTGNSHSITVKWKASDDCDGYQIYRSVSPDGNYELVQTVSNESRSSWWYDDDDESFQTYTQKNLELGKIYYYKIRPYTTYIDETFYGDFSNYISCQVTINGTKVKSASSKKKRSIRSHGQKMMRLMGISYIIPKGRWKLHKIKDFHKSKQLILYSYEINKRYCLLLQNSGI